MVPDCFKVECTFYASGMKWAPIPLWRVTDYTPRSLSVIINHIKHVSPDKFHDEDEFDSNTNDSDLWFEFALDDDQSTKGNGYVYRLSTHRSPRTDDQILLNLYELFKEATHDFVYPLYIPAKTFQEWIESRLNQVCKSTTQKIADKIE